MDFLKRVYEGKKEYFENLDFHLQKVKELVLKSCPDAKIYLFGSVVEGDYSVGLSDIDVAIISNRFRNRDLKLEVFGRLTKKFFDSPFEFHVLTEEQWVKLRKLVGNYRLI